MKIKIIPVLFYILLLGNFSCKKDSSLNKNPGTIQLISLKVGASVLDINTTVINVPVDQPIQFVFSSPVDTISFKNSITLKDPNGSIVPYLLTSANNLASITLTTSAQLLNSTNYTLAISFALKGINGETYPGLQFKFTTIPGVLVVSEMNINGKIMSVIPLQNIDPKNLNIQVTFSQPLDPNTFKSSISFTGPPLTISLSADNKTLLATNTTKAKGLSLYSFSISSTLTSAGGFSFGGSSIAFTQPLILHINTQNFRMMNF